MLVELVEGVEHDEYRKKEMKRVVELMGSPVVVDCKNVFTEDGRIVYLGIGKDD